MDGMFREYRKKKDAKSRTLDEEAFKWVKAISTDRFLRIAEPDQLESVEEKTKTGFRTRIVLSEDTAKKSVLEELKESEGSKKSNACTYERFMEMVKLEWFGIDKESFRKIKNSLREVQDDRIRNQIDKVTVFMRLFQRGTLSTADIISTGKEILGTLKEITSNIIEGASTLSIIVGKVEEVVWKGFYTIVKYIQEKLKEHLDKKQKKELIENAVAIANASDYLASSQEARDLQQEIWLYAYAEKTIAERIPMYRRIENLRIIREKNGHSSEAEITRREKADKGVKDLLEEVYSKIQPYFGVKEKKLKKLTSDERIKLKKQCNMYCEGVEKGDVTGDKKIDELIDKLYKIDGEGLDQTAEKGLRGKEETKGQTEEKVWPLKTGKAETVKKTPPKYKGGKKLEEVAELTFPEEMKMREKRDIVADTMVKGNKCLVGYNSIVNLIRGEGGYRFLSCEKYKKNSTTKSTIEGEPPTISEMSTGAVSTCTIFIIMSKGEIEFAHVDSTGIEVLFSHVMGKTYTEETKVFASRISGTEDVEDKRVTEMINHINPKRAVVIDRMGGQDQENGLEHDIVRVSFVDKDTMTVSCNVVKGHWVGRTDPYPTFQQIDDWREIFEFKGEEKTSRGGKKVKKGEDA